MRRCEHSDGEPVTYCDHSGKPLLVTERIQSGPVQRAPLGPPQRLTGGPGQLFPARLATRRRKYRRPWTQKGSIGGLCPPRAEGPSDASRHDATCCRSRRPGRSCLCRLRRPGRRAAASGRPRHVLARSPQDAGPRRGRRPGGAAGDGLAVAQRRRRDRGRPGAARRHRGDRRETGSACTRAGRRASRAMALRS